MSLTPDGEDPVSLLHRAMDGGINYFDTADIYQDGWNEEVLGRAIQGRRDDVIVATKVGNQRRADGSGLDWNPSKQHILASVDKSLQRLNTDYIDLYQLHGGTYQDNIAETIEAFETLMQLGKIRYYGISSIRPNVIREYVERSKMVSVMMQYSLLDRRPEEEALGLLQEHEISVLARGTLASGLLTGKPAKPYLGHDEQAVRDTAERVRQFSDNNRGPAATATRFVLNHSAVTSAVIGIRTGAQLDEALAIPDSRNLSQGSSDALRKYIEAKKYTDHR